METFIDPTTAAMIANNLALVGLGYCIAKAGHIISLIKAEIKENNNED